MKYLLTIFLLAQPEPQENLVSHLLCPMEDVECTVVELPSSMA